MAERLVAEIRAGWTPPLRFRMSYRLDEAALASLRDREPEAFPMDE
ncbi:hypothetical protein [Isoptericola sediminis]|uniref:Uncharacterized protein n=1 Tax=Isoptericola sediminis TaxID=2733572 RepID=A0A849JYU1_9MICO|nr:hypothetical protein [Isoptericola sediminis]NNU28456.1 hypothetical protein [Isoptericola sediminis]